MKKNLFRTLTLAATLAASLGASAHAADVSLSVPLVSSYVWRGLEANPDPVLQPSLTMAANHFTFNLWGNIDLTGYGETAGYGNRSGEFTELDLTLEYGKSFGPVSAAVGIISYVFPGLAATTHELYARVAADVLAAPSLTVYSDVDEIKGSYFLLAAGHGFTFENLGPVTGLNLGLSVGYGSGSYNRGYFGVDKAAPVDLVGTLSLPLTFSGLTLTPSVAYSALLDSEISDSVGETGYLIYALTLGVTL